MCPRCTAFLALHYDSTLLVSYPSLHSTRCSPGHPFYLDCSTGGLSARIRRPLCPVDHHGDRESLSYTWMVPLLGLHCQVDGCR